MWKPSVGMILSLTGTVIGAAGGIVSCIEHEKKQNDALRNTNMQIYSAYNNKLATMDQSSFDNYFNQKFNEELRKRGL